MPGSKIHIGILATLICTVHALHGIVVPSNIQADQQFKVTFEAGGSSSSDQYRVFLAAASVGQNGPMCYLQNSTTLTSPFTLSIPAAVGPNASDYSIALADASTSQGATYSNRFNFTGGTSKPTEYESHLNGAPFWNAYDLPCTAISCARQCAMDSYPDDLTDNTAHATMKTCIEKCPGIAPDPSATQPAQASSGIEHQQASPSGVVLTLGSSVVTAYGTQVTVSGSTVAEAVLGSQTLTLGGSAQTVASASVGLVSAGLDVGGSTTVAFSGVSPASSRASVSAAAAASSSPVSTGAAARVTGVAFAGAAGLAALIL